MSESETKSLSVWTGGSNCIPAAVRLFSHSVLSVLNALHPSDIKIQHTSKLMSHKISHEMRMMTRYKRTHHNKFSVTLSKFLLSMRSFCAERCSLVDSRCRCEALWMWLQSLHQSNSIVSVGLTSKQTLKTIAPSISVCHMSTSTHSVVKRVIAE